MTKSFVWVFAFIIVSLWYQTSPRLWAGEIVNPSDKDYFVHPGEGFNWIFPREYENLVQRADTITRKVSQTYSEEFGWTLDEKTNLILTSSHNQVPNAFSSNFPNLHNVYFPGGVSLIDFFATKSWLNAVLIHETAHLYQMNVKDSLSSFAKKVFGNNIVTFLPLPAPTSPITTLPLPVFTNPNILLPTLLVEGNATYNESRFGNGGRLYSGEARAIYLALAKGGKLSVNRLTNNHLYFPFTAEKYIVGGFLNLFIAKKYGTEKPNAYFLDQATHYFWPLKISSTHAELYGKNYYELLDEFIEYSEKLAQGQSSEKGEIIAKSIDRWPLHKTEGNVYFIATAQRGTVDKDLYKVAPGGKLEKQKTTLLGGKVFPLGGNFYTASTGRKGRRKIVHGLWGEDRLILKNSQDKYYLDIQGKNKLYFWAPESFDEPQLYRNGKKIGTVHSSGLLGPEGEPIFFKQNKKTRSLYKGSRRLFSYQGYYGYVVDVVEDDIYFVANTRWGSGLYVYSDSRIYRMGDSDTIADARRLDGNQFLIVEVDTEGYNYKISRLSRRQENPFVIEYFFEKEKEFELLDDVATKQASSLATKSYNSLGNLRFNNWQFLYFGTETGPLVSASAVFSDPLQYNQIILGVVSDNENPSESQDASALYMNQKHLIEWGLGVRYTKEKEEIAGMRFEQEEKAAEFVLGYMFYNSGFWRVHTSGKFAYEFVDDFNGRNRKDKEYYVDFEVRRKRSTALGFSSYRLWNNISEFFRDDRGRQYAYTGQLGHGLGREWYMKSLWHYTQSDRGEMLRGRMIKPLPTIFLPTGRDTIYSPRDIKLARFSLGFQKAFFARLQGSWFPIGLRRLGVTPLMNYYNKNIGDKNNEFEYGLLLESELLVAHIAPMRVGLSYLKSNDANIGDNFVIALGSEF